MAERIQTEDGTPIGGWVLRSDGRSFDVRPMLEEYGQVFRYPVDPNARVDLMAPGQPCFLHIGDRSRVVGLWAIGEVVAPALALPVDPGGDDTAEQLYAEVELLALAKPIPDDKLRADPKLARSELFTAGDRPNPLVLRPVEVRAIEAFDFELVPPTDEQAARLEALLDAEESDDDAP